MNSLTSTSKPLVTPAPNFSEPPKNISPVQTIEIKGFGQVDIRAIRPDDEVEMIRFHQELSDESIHMRYFEYLGLDRRTSHERLVGICKNTPDSYAVVMEFTSASDRPASILGVGRLTLTSEPFEATFDTLISGEKHAPRLGKIVLHRLIKLAQAFGFQKLTGELLVADHDSIAFCRELGFSLHTLPEDGLVRVTLLL